MRWLRLQITFANYYLITAWVAVANGIGCAWYQNLDRVRARYTPATLPTYVRRFMVLGLSDELREQIIIDTRLYQAKA